MASQAGLPGLTSVRQLTPDSRIRIHKATRRGTKRAYYFVYLRVPSWIVMQTLPALYSDRTSTPPGGVAGPRRDLPSARRRPHPRISPA